MFAQINNQVKTQKSKVKIPASTAKRGEQKSGFTLIELLVVISIIGILVSVFTARYQTSEKQARDTKRKSDLSQYRTALENYAVVNDSLYPTPAGAVCVDAASGLCTGNFKSEFLPSCPDDQRKDENHYYLYCASASDYSLSAMLEGTGTIWHVCSGGQVCATEATDFPTSTGCICP